MTGGIGTNQTIKALKEGQWGEKSSGNMSRIYMLPQKTMVATALPHRMQETTPEEPAEIEEEANEVCTKLLGVASPSKGGPVSIEIDGVEESAHKNIEVEVETSMMVSGRPGEFTDTQGDDKSLGSTK